MNTLPDPSERIYLPPAGLEQMHETAKIEHVGGVACMADLEAGMLDNTGTPDKMDDLFPKKPEDDDEDEYARVASLN